MKRVTIFPAAIPTMVLICIFLTLCNTTNPVSANDCEDEVVSSITDQVIEYVTKGDETWEIGIDEYAKKGNPCQLAGLLTKKDQRPPSACKPGNLISAKGRVFNDFFSGLYDADEISCKAP